MPLSLINNVSSANAIRRLSGVTKELSGIQEHLSSGLRIARPSDDAAGLAISKGLNTDARVYSQSVRNVNDAVALLNTAEGAVSQLSSIVTRQRELAEQAANGVYSGRQRAALNAEANALVNEYNRIVRSASFNNVSVIDGVNDSFVAQQGYGAAESTTIGVAQSLGTAAGTGQFTNLSVDVLGATRSVVGDLNGDGNEDVISFDTGSATAFVILGCGNGNFGTAVTTPFGIQVSAVRLADIDNDGDLDLIATSTTSDRAFILRANGNGTFNAAVSFTLPGASLDPVDVQLRDVNGDGNLDFIAALQGADGRIGVYLGNGDSTFKAGVAYVVDPANVDPQSLVIGDYNGDGTMDAAVGVSSGTYILIGNTDGSFRASTSFASGTGTTNIVQGDLNGDGYLDLVMTGVGGANVNVMLGNGDGTFRAPVSLNPSAGVGVNSVVAADFNGDGFVDIANSDRSGGVVNVYLGNGNGTFRAALTSSVTAPTYLVLADFNRDGVVDLLADRSAGTDRFTVMTGSSDTTGRRNNFQYSLDLLTINSARNSLVTLEAQQNRINLELGKIGAFQSRLSSAVNNLENRRLNYRDAQSRIEDVDVAEESARLISRQIVQKSALAVLAQANQQPQLALKLLNQSAEAS